MVIFNLQYMIQNQYFIMPWVNVNDHVPLLPEIKPLLEKISKLSDHFKKFKKDKHSTMGLTKSVNRRKKLLAYLKRKNPESYSKVIKQLNLRK